jgi:outer membrane protein assembly factor BamB
MSHRTLIVGVCCSLLVLSVTSLEAGDWPRFRGPNGSGVSTDTNPLPATWSDEENMQWKIELPGPGSSSPIVVGDRVYITCWTGYGLSEEDPGDQANLQRHLICIDRNDGSVIWDKSVPAELPEDVYRGMIPEHGYASHTPVSDGERIYVFYGKSGALAYDLEGNELWHTMVGDGLDPLGWGSSSSPVLHDNILIITASAESTSLVGLDTATGDEVWRQEAGSLASTWGTPVLAQAEDRTDLVIGVPNEIWGLNPATGKLRWYCSAIGDNSYCSSVIADEVGTIYGIEGRGGGSIAVRAGGSGDVSESHVVWSGRDNNRIGTPVLYEGRIYFASGGALTCIDAATDEEIYRERLQASRGADDQAPPAGGGRPGGGRGGFGGQDYSSPVIGDGKLYYVTRGGICHVVALGDTFEQLASNRMTSETEDFSGTPAISDGQIFIRSSKHLYCISERE